MAEVGAALRRGVLACAGLSLVLGLPGCATYQPLPLATADDLVRSAAHLAVDPDRLSVGSIRRHVFDPSDGFDMTELAMLALANNPDLKVARADAGLSRAQAFSAGLLPDPQLSLTRDHQLGYPAGSTLAYTAGLTYDLTALLTHPALAAARDADTRKADLNLLWMEWQAVAQARMLFLKIRSQERTLDVLRRSREVFLDRYDRTRRAAERGLITSDAVSPHLTALQDVNRQLNDLERQANQSRHDINALVGVAPDVRLELTDDRGPDAVAEEPVRTGLATTLAKRPDLLALQAGYEAEDDRYRGALLAQFPTFTFGPQRARDTTNVNTTGFSLGITLPIFNRNRGNIAVEKATRAKLHVEYQQRIDATTTEVDRLLKEQAILERQQVEVHRALDTLSDVADRAARAFAARNVDALTLTNAQSGLLNKQIEAITIDEALAEQRVALQTLVSSEMPTSDQTHHEEKAP